MSSWQFNSSVILFGLTDRRTDKTIDRHDIPEHQNGSLQRKTTTNVIFYTAIAKMILVCYMHSFMSIDLKNTVKFIINPFPKLIFDFIIMKTKIFFNKKKGRLSAERLTDLMLAKA